MSRTFKTNPLLVRCLTQPGMIEENHDHTSGECDLPPKPTKRTDLDGEPTVWGAGGRCTWVPSMAFWRSPLGVCGCGTCGMKWWLREERRKQRYAARSQVREAFVDLAEHGVYDGLGDVRSPFASGDIEDEEHEMYTKLRDALGLAPDYWVVDYNYAEPDFDAYADLGESPEAMWAAVEGFRVPDSSWVLADIEVLYPDGRREWLTLDKNGIKQ